MNIYVYSNFEYKIKQNYYNYYNKMFLLVKINIIHIKNMLK